jgi:predicted phage tail protein
MTPGQGSAGASGSISWSCFTSGGTTGTFGPAGCSSARQTTSRLLPSATSAAAIVAPNAPSNLAATVSGSTVTLNWTAPAAGDAPTSYQVQAGSSTGQTNIATFDTGSTSTSIAVFGVPAGTYFIRVRAVNSGGASDASNEVQVVVGGAPPPCTPLSPPSGLVASINGGTVTLSWGAPAGCAPTSYVIQAGSTPSASNLANFSTGSTATTFTATGVGAGTYYLRILSAEPGVLSAPSTEIAFTVGSCATAPGAPTNLAASVSGSTVAITWTAPASACAATSYLLQAGSTPGASNLANTPVGGTGLTATNVGNGTYYVRVIAVNTVGQSPASTEIVVTLPPAPVTIVAGFQFFDLATQSGPTTECRFRAPNNSSPITCTLRSTSFTTSTNTIVSYTWNVQYTHGTVTTISRTQSSPNLSFTDVCDSPDGVNGGTDNGVSQPLVVSLTVTDNIGATATVSSDAGSQPPLVVRLYNCGK